MWTMEEEEEESLIEEIDRNALYFRCILGPW